MFDKFADAVTTMLHENNAIIRVRVWTIFTSAATHSSVNCSYYTNKKQPPESLTSGGSNIHIHNFHHEKLPLVALFLFH